MKVLVTGATGFIGRLATGQLRERGAEVRCLVRPSSDRSALAGLDCEFAEGDMTDAGSLAKAVEGCSTVLHLAAETRPAAPERLRAVNVAGSGELAARAAAAGVERFIYVSTLTRARQGAPAPRPWARVALSKLSGEVAVLEKIPAAVLRSAPCFGPRDHLVCPLLARLRRSRFVALFPGQGTFATQPIWSGDLAECLASAALSGKVEPGPRELAGPEEMAVVEFWDRLAAALGAARLRLHLPETFLRAVGFPLARATGRLEFLRLAEFFIGRSTAERNLAPILLGRDLVTVEEGVRKLLGLAAGPAGSAARTEA